MAEEFKAINTQEEFDAAIKSRLERERETVRKEFADYNDLKTQVTTLQTEKAGIEKTLADERTTWSAAKKQHEETAGKLKSLELDKLKTDIAIEKGLPLDLRSRLTGETKEDIEKDAENLAKLFKSQNQKNLPGFNGSSGGGDDKNSEIKKMLRELKGE